MIWSEGKNSFSTVIMTIFTITIFSFCLVDTAISADEPNAGSGGTTHSYSIIYDDNVTSNMPTDASSQTFGATISVSSTVPTRPGFNNIGWCSVIPTYLNGTDTCTGGTQYSAGSDLAIDQTGTNNNFHLYAMWESSDPCLGVNSLYCSVANMSKGTQTASDLQQTITVPTSDDYTTDTSNSGVYEYDPSVFGAASDADNTSTIYYYRGVLEQTVGSYGSDGSATTYPNYVVLSSASDKSGLTATDTCWRIVRTTGSGGVKMIYNGKWTGSTCANSTTNTKVTTSVYNGTSSTNKQIVRIGYTYNSTYATNTASTATIASVLGSDSNPAVNNTRSDIKTYIEDTWYAGNMTSYTGMLEPSAGYCNDRTVYDNTDPYTLQPESTNIVTYGTSGMTIYNFGSRIRNYITFSANNNRTLTLNCARSTVDLYRYVANSTGVSNELKYPAALLTADEAAFAGSGSNTANRSSAYHSNSFLRSGFDFWLLSPHVRYSSGNTNGFLLYSDGALYGTNVDNANGVRPAISLTSGTTAVSGSGVATDPWIVNAP